MLIQINTDHNIEGHEGLTAYVSGVVEDALSPFVDHLTRVEVHLSDDDGAHHKTGHKAMRCVIEARLEGAQPLAVTAHDDSLHMAISSAADKLARLIGSTLGRLHDQQQHRAALTPAEQTVAEA